MTSSSISVVIDSSVAFKWLVTIDEINTKEADKLLKDFERGKIRIFMPELSKYEIANTLLKKRLTETQVKDCLNKLYQIPIRFVAENIQIAKLAMEYAIKYKITYYDASFIAHAQQLNSSLVTENIKHHGRYKGKDVKIIALSDYK